MSLDTLVPSSQHLRLRQHEGDLFEGGRNLEQLPDFQVQIQTTNTFLFLFFKSSYLNSSSELIAWRKQLPEALAGTQPR